MHDVEIEMLQGDAAKRQLYADPVDATHLPPLRTFCDIMCTQYTCVHFVDSTAVSLDLGHTTVDSWSCALNLVHVLYEGPVALPF